MDNFEPLIVHMKAACKNMNRQFAGALLRPHGPALTYMKRSGSSGDDVFEAAREAGRQLIRDGRMSVETLNIISRELIPLEKYVEQVNRSFQKALQSATRKSN